MSGTGASLTLSGHGFAQLPATLDLQPTASGAWTDTGLQVMLPGAGTYHLDATARGALAAVSPVNAYISARLWDVTLGVIVPGSETILTQINLNASSGVVSSGINGTSPIAVEYTVTAPRTVRLQARRLNAAGASTTASIPVNADGRTTLRYHRVA